MDDKFTNAAFKHIGVGVLKEGTPSHFKQKQREIKQATDDKVNDEKDEFKTKAIRMVRVVHVHVYVVVC